MACVLLLLPIHHSNPKVKINDVFQVRQEGPFVRTGDLVVSSSSQNCVDQVIHGDKIGKQIAHSCFFGLNPPRAGKQARTVLGFNAGV